MTDVENRILQNQMAIMNALMTMLHYSPGLEDKSDHMEDILMINFNDSRRLLFDSTGKEKFK